MILVPMQNTRQWHFRFQLLDRYLHSRCAKPDRFRRLTNPQHRHPFPRNIRLLPKPLKRITAPIILRNHTKTSRTTVHRVELFIVGEGFLHFLFNNMNITLPGYYLRTYHVSSYFMYFRNKSTVKIEQADMCIVFFLP